MGQDIARAFRSVDGAVDPGALAGYLDLAAADPFWREVKRATLEALVLGPGDRALDVGCGLGGDVLAMAEVVGPGGRAVGVDVSDRLLAEARSRVPPGTPVDLVLGDAAALPFPDGTFAGVRTERTLQHVADPAAVLAEMARVTAPGGRVAAWEGEWDTLVVDVEPLEITRLVCRRRADAIRHPSIGRRLPALFAAAGLAVERVEPFTQIVRDGEMAEVAFAFTAEAERLEAEGAVDAGRGRAWAEDLRGRVARGALLASLTGFLVVARR